MFGATLMIYGRLKLNKERRAQTIANFRTQGVPPIAVMGGIVLEFFGGLFLVPGLIVPVVAAFEAIYFLSIVVTKRTKENAKFVAFGKPNYELEVSSSCSGWSWRCWEREPSRSMGSLGL